MLPVLLDVALDLTASLPTEARYRRLVGALRQVVPCDAGALLRLEDGVLVPLAVDGLKAEALERRFVPAEHPRLQAILASRGPVRFAADDPRPDPYDGLLAHLPGPHLGVHACMGCALYHGDALVGALTADAVRPGAFEGVEDSVFAAFGALAAAAMHTAGLIEALERSAERRGQVAQHLVQAALARHGGELVGQGPAIGRLRREIDVVAASDLAVLVTGDTGVGKELVVRTIHARSGRAHQPLVYVNCAALPEMVAESELFGHVRGAFTGAVQTRLGRFELADGGTLFLDEVGELSPAIQPKLLRVLQFGEIQRVGADRTSRVDVRVIAATNRDLDVEVTDGRFRADLYHRLSVFPVRVPSLRERPEDVATLVRYFLDRARLQLGAGRAEISPAAMDALVARDWPGNVRELEHAVTRALLRATGGRPGAAGRIDLAHLGPDAAPGPAALTGDPAAAMSTLAEATRLFQRRAITEALAAAGGSWAAAARRLGVDRGNIHRLARRLGLKSPEEAPEPHEPVRAAPRPGTTA